MRLMDQIPLAGVLHIKVYKLIDGEKRLINEFKDNNLIMTSGLQLITYLLAGYTGNNKITRVGVGDGTAPPHKADTGLTNAYIKPIDSYSYLSQNVIEYTISINTGDANALLISEFGLFSGDDVIFSRKLQDPAIPKSSDIIVEGKWTVSIFQCKENLFSSSAQIKHITSSEINYTT